MIVVGAVLLPLLIGTVGFKIRTLLSYRGGDVVGVYASEVRAQQAALEHAKREANTHLNALALKMGQMQAQVLRVNALGQRLTRMAGLDPREFNFEADVAQGGPEQNHTLPGWGAMASLEQLWSDISSSQARLQALESLMLDRKLSQAVTPSGWPARGGYLSSKFGSRVDPFTGQPAYHAGVDIAASLGSPVRAAADGVVSFAGERANYGLLVEINHGAGLITRYGHISSLIAKMGDKVTRGDTVALMGSSGRSTGPHLHFEVVKDGQSVNPVAYLKQVRAN